MSINYVMFLKNAETKFNTKHSNIILKCKYK